MNALGESRPLLQSLGEVDSSDSGRDSPFFYNIKHEVYDMEKFKVDERWKDSEGVSYEITAVGKRGFLAESEYGGEASYWGKEQDEWTKTHEAGGAPVCQYCSHKATDLICGKVSIGGSGTCSRLKGHSDEHVACGGLASEHNRYRWPQQAKKPGERRLEIVWDSWSGLYFYPERSADYSALGANGLSGFIAWEYEDGYRSRVSPTMYRVENGKYCDYSPSDDVKGKLTLMRAVAVILKGGE